MLRLLSCIVFFHCHAALAEVQDDWYGRYAFVSTGMNVTATRSWVDEDLLDIHPDGDRIVAVYNAAMNGDGFDYLAQRWIGEKRANAIVFTFDSCLPRSTLAAGDVDQSNPSVSSNAASSEEACTDQHQRGTPMLTLVAKRGKGGKRVVLTFFHEFKPRLDKVRAGGNRYFQKVVHG